MRFMMICPPHKENMGTRKKRHGVLICAWREIAQQLTHASVVPRRTCPAASAELAVKRQAMEARVTGRPCDGVETRNRKPDKTRSQSRRIAAVLIYRYVRQPRAGQQEAREADRAVVVVIGWPRPQLLYGPLCRLGVTNAHDIGAIEL